MFLSRDSKPFSTPRILLQDGKDIKDSKQKTKPQQNCVFNEKFSCAVTKAMHTSSEQYRIQITVFFYIK